MVSEDLWPPNHNEERPGLGPKGGLSTPPLLQGGYCVCVCVCVGQWVSRGALNMWQALGFQNGSVRGSCPSRPQESGWAVPSGLQTQRSCHSKGRCMCFWRKAEVGGGVTH